MTSESDEQWVHTGRFIDGKEVRYFANRFDVTDPVKGARFGDGLSALADANLKLGHASWNMGFDETVLLGRSKRGILYVFIFRLRDSLIDGKTHINVVDVIPSSDYKAGAFGSQY